MASLPLAGAARLRAAVLLRRRDNFIRDGLRSVDIIHFQPAGFARRLDRDVAHAQHAMAKRLIDAHVLHFRELNIPRGLRKQARLVSQFVAGDGHLHRLPADVASNRQ